jgi:LysM repeat protein
MVQDDQVFENLKQKYQTVFNLIQHLQIRVHNINLQGGKLLIRAVAPSVEVKNRVWDQIKRVDANSPDLICDISVFPRQKPAEGPPSTMTAGASANSGRTQRFYTVRPGDTLSTISREFYGDATQHTKILDANRGVLNDPNQISPGQELVIPE